MPYQIDRRFITGGRFPLIVNDKFVDTEATSLAIIGKGAKNYGEMLMENLLHMLEHFASINPPANPIEGQLWFDLNQNALKVFNTENLWVSVNRVSTNEPQNPTDGDLWLNPNTKVLNTFDTALQRWKPLNPFVQDMAPPSARQGDFWYDTANREFKVYDGTNWRTASGPQFTNNTMQPNNPEQGDLWYNNNIKRLQVYVNNSWVPVVEIYSQSSAPQQAREGAIWWDSNNNQFYVFSETAGWVFVGPLPYTISQSEPVGQNEGDMWWNVDENRFFIYDATLSRWILVGPSLRLSAAAPSNPVAGDLWFNTGTKVLNVWDTTFGASGSWVSVNTDFSLINATDTPPSYVGAANRYLAVNSTETGVVFATPPSAAFETLSDGPGTYTGAANSFVTVNSSENGVEYTPQEQIMPTGAILPYGGSIAPSGWLVCDGSAVSRSIYANLFVAFGTTYGSGDGSTTFNLPDLRGRMMIGAGTGPGLTTKNLGDASGAETHQLTESEIPIHSHEVSYSGTTNSAGAHMHGFGGGSGAVYGQGSDPVSFTGLGSGVEYTDTDMAGDHVHSYSFSTVSNVTGGDQPHNNMPPYLAINYIVKF